MVFCVRAYAVPDELCVCSVWIIYLSPDQKTKCIFSSFHFVSSLDIVTFEVNEWIEQFKWSKMWHDMDEWNENSKRTKQWMSSWLYFIFCISFYVFQIVFFLFSAYFEWECFVCRSIRMNDKHILTFYKCHFECLTVSLLSHDK